MFLCEKSALKFQNMEQLAKKGKAMRKKHRTYVKVSEN